MNERSFISEAIMNDEIPSRRERTRAEIIRAAHDLFIQQGYHGTSMRQIAGQAGVALGGLYNHFENKEHVFKAVLLEYHPYREIFPFIYETNTTDIEGFLRLAIHRMVQVMQQRPDFMNLMFIEIVEFKSTHIQELFDLIMPQAMPLILKVMGLHQAELRPIPPFMLMRIFIGLFFAYYLTEIIIADHAPPEFNLGAEEYFVELILHGILAQAAPGQTEAS
jgi:AcrR family transcriptional regulator